MLLVFQYMKMVVLYNLSSFLAVYNGMAVVIAVNPLWTETNPLTFIYLTFFITKNLLISNSYIFTHLKYAVQWLLIYS